jgi:predicted nucleic acid-binding protein
VSLVLDTSIALAWCFEDEQTPGKMELLDRVTEAGAVVPQLWPLEALNGLLAAQRRGRLDAALRKRLAGFLRGLPIAIDEDTTRQVWSATVGLAESYGLTVYDAAYLELAIRLGVPLASGDIALRAAADGAGVPLLRVT